MELVSGLKVAFTYIAHPYFGPFGLIMMHCTDDDLIHRHFRVTSKFPSADYNQSATVGLEY